MFADKNGTRLLAAKFPEDLRALAIKPFAKLDVWRDRIRPPVPFDMSIRPDVAHDCGASLSNVRADRRSEEHTSELQSRRDLVCRLLLEKKNPQHRPTATSSVGHRPLS